MTDRQERECHVEGASKMQNKTSMKNLCSAFSKSTDSFVLSALVKKVVLLNSTTQAYRIPKIVKAKKYRNTPGMASS